MVKMRNRPTDNKINQDLVKHEIIKKNKKSFMKNQNGLKIKNK